MGFGVCLSKCAPATANPLDALSGDILTYFDVTWRGNCFEGIQKSGVPIPAITLFDLSLYDLYINVVVTEASQSYDIGAACNVVPNGSAYQQDTGDDYASVYTSTTNAPQPVSLVSFTVQAQADRTVLLNWKTSWERNNKGYVVERSKDLKSFEVVGQVTDVPGTSIHSYQFVDKSPYRGTSYYRLVQFDGDGSRHTYKAEPVVVEGRYGVYPNPLVSSEGFTLELDEPSAAVLHLYDGSGREVGLIQRVVSDVSAQVRPSAKLSPGHYILSVEERGATRKHRVIMP